MPERDENEEAVRNVEKATESDPAKGEDLLESEELKRKLAEAKKRAAEKTVLGSVESGNSRSPCRTNRTLAP